MVSSFSWLDVCIEGNVQRPFLPTASLEFYSHRCKSGNSFRILFIHLFYFSQPYEKFLRWRSESTYETIKCKCEAFSAVEQTESPRGSSGGPGASRNCATHQKRTGGSHRKIKVPVEKKIRLQGRTHNPPVVLIIDDHLCLSLALTGY